MINSKTIANGILRSIGIIAAICLLLLFIYKIQTVITYVIISIILTLIANPVVNFFSKKLKFSNLFAVISTMGLFFVLMIGLFLMFVPLIISQSNNLSLLNTKSIENNVIELVYEINTFFESYHINSSKFLNREYITSRFDFDILTTFINKLLDTVTSFGIGFASVMFITFILLKDKEKFVINAKKILPDRQEDKILNSVDKINNLLSRYFIGLIIQLVIILILYFIVLILFDIENAFIIAFLCAVLNIIPYVGPLIGSIIAGILTMLQYIGEDFQTEIIPKTIFVVTGFFIVQLIDNNISQPIIFSNSVKSHPLEIFLVILISGFLFGITGMIIAIPFYTILKVIGKEFLPENKIIRLLTRNI